MNSRPKRTPIRPKVSSIPRQQSEATIHLEIYKMSVEKHRLKKELEMLKSREEKINKRLAEIETACESLMQQVNTPETSETKPASRPLKSRPQSDNTSTPQWKEVYLEY